MRSSLLSLSLLGLSAATILLPVDAAFAQARPVAAPAGRSEIDLSTGWRFRFGAADAAAPGFDDAGWERVGVPHTWNRMGAYALTRPPRTDNREGVAWYRLHVRGPAARRARDSISTSPPSAASPRCGSTAPASASIAAPIPASAST